MTLHTLSLLQAISQNITRQKQLASEQEDYIHMMESHASDVSRSLQLLSGNIQQSVKSLQEVIETHDPQECTDYHEAIRENFSALKNQISLLATMLEMNSSDILGYIEPPLPQKTGQPAG